MARYTRRYKVKRLVEQYAVIDTALGMDDEVAYFPTKSDAEDWALYLNARHAENSR